MKQADAEMHYRGVSTIETQKADPLGPLVERYLLRGDEEAMDRLVERTRPKLMGVARRIGAPQDAEDAVQGAYVALVRKRGQSLGAPVMPWLLTTVVRLAYRRKAKQRRQRDLAARLAEPREGERPAAVDPQDALLGAERELIVRAAVAALPSRYRDPVVLRHLEGLTNQETAALLDLPEATLRTRLHRAAKLLRSRVAPVLLASLMFFPWCVADALRRVVPLTQPMLGKPLAALVVIAIATVGSLAVLTSTPNASRGSATHPPARTTESGVDRVGPVAPGGGPEEGAPKDDPRPETPDDDAKPTKTPRRVERPLAPPPVIPSGIPPSPSAPGRTPLEPDPFPETPGFSEIGDGQVTLPRPAGMVLMEGGHVLVGTKPADLAATLAGRPPEIRALFAYEVPRHRVALPSYWIAKHEVTNAQYLAFLQDHAITHTTQPNGLDNLEDLAARLVGQTPTEQRSERQRVWRQLYEANRGAIWKAFSKADRDVLVFRKDLEVDLEATAQRCRRERLPGGITLTFYRWRPPANWPGLLPPAGQLDHPVCTISYNDAERLAEWAGLHIPTEAEWEWAARGPDGHVFPWGSTWFEDASHANWGGQITDARHATATLPVASLEAGRSWCGLYHMCGNAAEWTSSWFGTYPGSKAPRHRYMGRWVKVIRGGSAADGDKLALRSAVRNFIGGGAKAPPFPDNGFRFVGVRLAAYRQPGLDQVGPVVRRACGGRRLKAEALATERFAAFVSNDWVKPEAVAANHVTIRGRSTAVVFVPVTHLLRNQPSPIMQAAWKDPQALRKLPGLLRAARTKHPYFVAGVLHSDLPLEGLEVPDHAANSAKKKRKRRGRSKPPITKPGGCAAGTYLVTLWFGRLALTTPDLEFVGFLPGLGKKIPSVEVRPRPSKELGSPTLRPSLEADEGALDLTVPLGGSRSPEKTVVRLRARLPYAKDAFHGAHARAPWLRSTDGR